ncbi:hypothetical protein XENOCAPTIV_017636 [Xenoophorus captivus]|uniref:Uncharacterized protein n=1 Tax=Xenoophorus captivus TaxID=1517983 RepID=A0ABV0RCQ1_9TELE
MLIFYLTEMHLYVSSQCVRAADGRSGQQHAALPAAHREKQSRVEEVDVILQRSEGGATISYYQLMHMQTVALPVHYQTLCESSKLYDPGQQYAAHVRDLQLPEQPVVHYSFETYSPSSSRYKLCLELTPLTKNLRGLPQTIGDC